MCPILSVKWTLIQQAQICLMNQGRALQGVAGALPLQMETCDVAKLFVDRRDKLLKPPLVARFPAREQLGDRLARLLRHRQLRLLQHLATIAVRPSAVNASDV